MRIRGAYRRDLSSQPWPPHLSPLRRDGLRAGAAEDSSEGVDVRDLDGRLAATDDGVARGGRDPLAAAVDDDDEALTGLTAAGPLARQWHEHGQRRDELRVGAGHGDAAAGR